MRAIVAGASTVAEASGADGGATVSASVNGKTAASLPMTILGTPFDLLIGPYFEEIGWSFLLDNVRCVTSLAPPTADR